MLPTQIKPIHKGTSKSVLKVEQSMSKVIVDEGYKANERQDTTEKQSKLLCEYFLYYCPLYAGDYFEILQLENLTQQPLFLPSNTNEIDSKGIGLVVKFLDIMCNCGFDPATWFASTTPNELMYYEDFSTSLLGLCAINQMKLWSDEDLDHLFRFLGATTAQYVIRRHHVMVAFNNLNLSEEKVIGLTEAAELLEEVNKYVLASSTTIRSLLKKHSSKSPISELLKSFVRSKGEEADYISLTQVEEAFLVILPKVFEYSMNANKSRRQSIMSVKSLPRLQQKPHGQPQRHQQQRRESICAVVFQINNDDVDEKNGINNIKASATKADKRKEKKTRSLPTIAVKPSVICHEQQLEVQHHNIDENMNGCSDHTAIRHKSSPNFIRHPQLVFDEQDEENDEATDGKSANVAISSLPTVVGMKGTKRSTAVAHHHKAKKAVHKKHSHHPHPSFSTVVENEDSV